MAANGAVTARTLDTRTPLGSATSTSVAPGRSSGWAPGVRWHVHGHTDHGEETSMP
jgi:hypothetical protein